MTDVIFDWSDISSADDFYSSLFAQVGAPEWHGRNLNALYDSLVVGKVNQVSPPYRFNNINISSASDEVIDLQRLVFGVLTDSVREHLGSELTIR